MNLTFEISGLETIDKDMEKINERVNTAVKKAMPTLYTKMKDLLRIHIKSDVYETYTPKAYPRRSEFPKFGTPLSDIDANSIPIHGDDTTTGFIYIPTGEHRGKKADLLGEYKEPGSDAPIIPNPANGQELVERIETGKGYDYAGEHANGAYLRPRPFFENFKKELIEGKAAENTLVAAMNTADPTLEVKTGGGKTIRDEND